MRPIILISLSFFLLLVVTIHIRIPVQTLLDLLNVIFLDFVDCWVGPGFVYFGGELARRWRVGRSGSCGGVGGGEGLVGRGRGREVHCFMGGNQWGWFGGWGVKVGVCGCKKGRRKVGQSEKMTKKSTSLLFCKFAHFGFSAAADCRTEPQVLTFPAEPYPSSNAT